ncbi:MAG: ImmA/IrrE family metallo-endopeptidase, partial [Planctomycetes bacterium]|nr:ImmA/IrrE family metallo-endopeptidase [Planctomycetota bacterium]
LRHDPRAERRQWAVAHEIGEHLAQRVFALLGVSARAAPPNAREQVANLLAARLLLPTPWFQADGERLAWDLLGLKQRYTSASHELIARRMLDMPPPVIVSIFDHDRLTFRRSNLPGRAPPISQQEAACRSTAHSSGKSASGETGLDVIQAWPVHEPDWKREIMRTTAEAACAAW